MPEQINSFEKGLNQDAPLERQPANTYRYALNAVDISKEGDQFKIISEKGNILFSDTLLTPDYTCIGSDTLNTDIILVFTNNTNTIIGIVDVNGVFTIKVNTTLLGLTKNTPVQIESRILFNGHRAIYMSGNPIRSIDLDAPVFDERDSKLFADINLPEISDLNVLEGVSGTLIAGVYQFVARYLQDDLSTTTFGNVSNPIPIVVDSQSSGRNNYDGEVVDTPVVNKNILINFSNVDTSKKFLEIVAIWYTGLAQVVNIKSVVKLPIKGTEMEYTFTGGETMVDVSLDSIVLPPTVFSGAKTLAQKDNRLFLGNLKQRAANNNLQTVANNIVVTYDIDSEEYQESVPSYYGDYKNPHNTFNGKTYMREEVYAFSFRVVYTDGSKSFAHHIPAIQPDNSWISADNYLENFSNFDASNTTGNKKYYPGDIFTYYNPSGSYINKKLGTYISAETYELGKNYPTAGTSSGGGNIYVRHHVMPPLDVEPHYNFVSGKQYIRRIKLRFTVPDLSLLSQGEQKEIVSYEILRGDRILENRTIVSQGLHQKMLTYWRNWNLASTGGIYLQHSPLFGNVILVSDGSVGEVSGFYSTDNVTPAVLTFNAFYVDADQYNNDSIGSLGSNNFINRHYSYYSPDWILGNIPQNGDYVKEKLKIKGLMASDNNAAGTNYGSTVTPSNANDWWLLQFCNYDRLDSDYNVNNKFNLLGNNVQLIQSTDPSSRTSTAVINDPIGHTVRTDFNTPYYIFGLTGAANSAKLFQDSVYTQYRVDIGSNDQYGGLFTFAPTHTRTLVNVCKNKNQIYNLNSTEYIPIATRNKDILGDIVATNGDTFISKFAFKTGFNFAVKIFADVDGDFNPSRVVIDVNTEARASNPRYGGLKGIPMQAMSYYWTESTVNTNYRHNTGPLYYPRSNWPDVLFVDAGAGNATGYNFVYSKDNDIKTAVGAPLGSVSVGDFTNRIAYSEQAFDSEQQDTYKIFKANNFHDIPKNKGVIWNLFVNNSTLYAHTPKTLWKTSVNERSAVQNAYDGNAILLGNGGLFPIPSQELLTIDGGYAGTISQWGGVNTPAGYLFPDALQGKYFLLGQGLQEVGFGMSRFLVNLKEGLIDNSGNYIDNPFFTKGITSVYDSRHNRFITTSKNITSFTLSYSLEAKCWRSFHSYTPGVYVAQDNEIYSINNLSKVYKHNSGDYLTYYGDRKNFELYFVIAQGNVPIIPDNLSIKQVVTTTNDVYLHQRTFNTIRVYNDKQNTDYIDVLCSNSYNTSPVGNQLLVTEKNNEFRYTIPKNAVFNDTINRFNTLNLITRLELDDPLRLYRDRMKGNYNVVELVYTPTLLENNKFTINFIKTSFRVNQF